jgi:hypothetical protein
MAFPHALEQIPLPSPNAFHRPRPGKSGKFNKNTQLIACVQERGIRAAAIIAIKQDFPSVYESFSCKNSAQPPFLFHTPSVG